jgi:hypothetical protein
MLGRSIQFRASSIAMYTLGAIFLVPLTIGVVLVNSNASQNDHAKQISRDIASMYAQGMDFSQSGNQTIATRVGEGLGMNIRAGQGLLILSKIRMVHDSDCGPESPGTCGNKGFAVVTQRYVIGNPALRPSSFGTPAGVNPATGNVQNWANDPSARAQDFSASLKPGEFVYAAECYLPSPDSHGGVYSRTMY